jgi:hypothetical protein
MLAALVVIALAADDLPALIERVYADFGRAAGRIAFEGETLDRLTILGRLASEPDPARRKRLFDALEPVRASIAGPYPELVRARVATWEVPPFEAAAARWDIAPATLEAWLISVLTAWRDAQPEGEVEPWDLAWSWGEADRVLARALPKDRMIATAVRYVADLGAPVDELRIELDLQPREGKDPVAFTDFVTRPRLTGGSWSEGRYRVSASYREGGLGNLYQLVHELGHGMHIAAIRPQDPAKLDWPDDDVFTEALADMIGVSVYDPAWQKRYLGVEASPAASLRARLGPAMLDVCWALFEWRVHRDPAASPNAIWTELTQGYLKAAPHPEIAWWAVRGQLVDTPGYMMNYALGTIVTENLRSAVRRGRGPKAFDSPKPGTYLWLARRLYRFGKERTAREVASSFLGGPIDPSELRSMMGAPPDGN